MHQSDCWALMRLLHKIIEQQWNHCQNNANFKACNYSNEAITLKVFFFLNDTIFLKEKQTLAKNTKHNISQSLNSLSRSADTQSCCWIISI